MMQLQDGDKSPQGNTEAPRTNVANSSLSPRKLVQIQSSNNVIHQLSDDMQPPLKNNKARSPKPESLSIDTLANLKQDSDSEDPSSSSDSETSPKRMSASAPEFEHAELASSIGTSFLSMSNSGHARRSTHSRRRRRGNINAPAGRGTPPLVRKGSRRRPLRKSSKSAASEFRRTSSLSKGEIATHPKTKATVAAKADEEIRAAAAHMIKKASKSHESQTEPKPSSEAAGDDRNKSEEKIRRAANLGLEFSTRTLGQMFDNTIDDDEEVGTYPMPQSLGSLSKEKRKQRKNSNNPLRFPRKTGSDSSDNSRDLGRSFTNLLSSVRRWDNQDFFSGVADKSPLGSTLLAQRDERFHKAVDQSINLMDAAGANYGGSPERGPLAGRGSLQRTPQTSNSQTRDNIRSVRTGRRPAKKRESVLQMMFGRGATAEERDSIGHGRNRDARKSMVDVKLDDPSRRHRSLSRGQVTLGRIGEMPKPSFWEKCGKHIKYWTIILCVLFLLLLLLLLIAFLADLMNTVDSVSLAPTAAPSSEAVESVEVADKSATSNLRSEKPVVLVTKSLEVPEMTYTNASFPSGDDYWDDDTLTRMESVILGYNLTDPNELRDPESSAHKAMQWLGQLQEGEREIEADETDELGEPFDWADNQKEIERYAIGVLYYATRPTQGKPPTAENKSESHASLRRNLKKLKPGNSRTASEATSKYSARGQVGGGTSNWMRDGSICDWEGIRCSDEGVVTHLKLPKAHLHGTIPPELSALKGLLELDFSHNYLHGSIPTTIGQLTRMAYLDLGKNRLKGVLPKAIGNLSSLHAINVSMNGLVGTIPSTLHDMKDLAYLILSDNRLEGSIPPFTGLPKLLELDLSVNALQDSLPPSLGALSLLETLKLHDNKVAGSIPVVWSKLSHLETLILHHNRLTGSLPASLSDMKQLRDLRLNHNMFSGTIPDLPSLRQLVHLHLNNNRFSGVMPAVAINNLETLLLFQNHIAGDASAICTKDTPNLHRFAADCKSEVSCDCCHECF